MTCEYEEDSKAAKIYQGDDAGAFGRHLIKVNAPIGLDADAISKVIFQCGKVSITYNNPTFPFFVDLTREQTKQLDYRNKCYLLCEDIQRKRLTLEGSLTLLANKQVVADDEV